MAEINADIYKSLGQNNTQMSPLQVLQLIGAANQNKLFQQDYNSKQAIGDAYKNNVGDDGKINTPGLMKDIAGAGFRAPEAAGQAITNATNQFGLDTSKLQFAQKTLGALASNPNVQPSDVAGWAANAARAGVDPDIVHGVLNDAYKSGNDPKALRKALAGQAIMSMGTGALEGTAGPPNDEGQIPQITKGEAILRQTGSMPDQTKTGMATSNPPGYQESAVAGANLRSDMRNRASTFGADMYPMTQLLSKLETAGPQGVGPGSQELNTMKSFVQSNLNWLPGADKIIGDPTKIQNYDEASKYATNLAGARAAQYGHGTDQAMATSLVGSPNTHISQLAGVDLTKAIIGLRRMDQAQALEADAKDVPVGKTGSWAAKWATNVDPRAFMVDLMNPDQLSNLQKTLAKNPKDYAKFNNSVKMAIDHGIITQPGGEHAPGQ